MANPNATNQYRQTQILTASQEQLVLMLFDGAIRFCEQAKQAWENNKLEEAHKLLVKVQDILMELSYSLDKEQGGELADRMASLYAYCYKELVDANLKHDTDKVSGVQAIIRDLREGWVQAMEKMAKEAGEKSKDSDTPKPKGQVLAKIPVAKIPAPDAGEHSSISVEG